MTPTDISNTAKAAEILVAAKAEVKELLKNNGNLSIGIMAGLDRLINSLNFVSGANPVAEKPAEFKPVTRMMGVDVTKKVAEVKPEDVNPAEEEKAKFRAKVDAFIVNIHDLDNDKILSDFRAKEDILVIRGAAKIAGLDDFKKAPIDGSFLDAIRNALKEKEDKAKEAEANNNKIDQE